MRLLRSSLLAALLVSAPAAALLVPSDAQASVSIAIGFDALVKDADTVGIVTPQEAKTLWEDGRIYTYTRVKIDQGIAGELGTGTEGWVRTMGGVVGKIGQMVDGEPVLTTNKPALLFLRKLKSGSGWEVSARAQGQYPVLTDSATKTRKVIRSASVGVLFPPTPPAPPVPARANAEVTVPNVDPKAQSVATPASTTTNGQVKAIRLAGDVIHDRPVDEVAREIATTWKKLHPATAPEKK